VTVQRPPNVYGKPLANGKVIWHWQPSSKDRKAKCPLSHRTLGADPLEAFQIAAELNEALRDWRNGVQSVPYLPGSFGWLLMEFLAHKDVKSLSQTAQAEYERHARYMMAVKEAGVPIEKKMLGTFSPLFALKLYERLTAKHSTGIANRCLVQARYAWNKLYVYHHKIIPNENPFEKIEADHHESEETIPATYDELQSFISAAIALGELGVAVGARLRWEIDRKPDLVTMKVTSLTDGWTDSLEITPAKVSEWAAQPGAPANLRFPPNTIPMFPVTELWRCRWPDWCGTWAPQATPVDMTIHGYRFN